MEKGVTGGNVRSINTVGRYSMKGDGHQKDDIFIGDDKWIKFIDLTGRYNMAVEIDRHLSPIIDFINSLETQCNAMCCGFDAFDFTPEGIAKSASKNDVRDLRRKFADVINVIDGLQAQVIVSSRMNNLADKTVFLQLLRHILDNIPSNIVSA
jgi:hypothetical protein